MEQCAEKAVDVKTLSPLTLAFVGDGVYSLLVREWLVSKANRPVGELHAMAVKLVCAEAQAEAIHALMPLLSEEEAAVFRRGRNAHTSRSGNEYHHATGFEALFGYLYLSGKTERINELFRHSIAIWEENHP